MSLADKQFVDALFDEMKQIRINVRAQALALEDLKELFDSNPMRKRANIYNVYTFLTTNLTADPVLLFDAETDPIFGGFNAHGLTVDDVGGATSVAFLRVNSPTGPRITIRSTLTLDSIDISKLYYDVTTAIAGTARIIVVGWVK